MGNLQEACCATDSSGRRDGNEYNRQSYLQKKRQSGAEKYIQAKDIQFKSVLAWFLELEHNWREYVQELEMSLD